MSAKNLDAIEAFIKVLEEELSTFTDRSAPLLSYQLESLKTCYDLLQENKETTKKRSKQRRSEILRARALLTDIYLRVGAEVFLLCAIAAPISTLEKFKPKLLIPKLQEWWRQGLHPKGLEDAAGELCSDNIVSAIATARKRQYSELGIVQGYSCRWYHIIFLLTVCSPKFTIS